MVFYEVSTRGPTPLRSGMAARTLGPWYFTRFRRTPRRPSAAERPLGPPDSHTSPAEEALFEEIAARLTRNARFCRPRRSFGRPPGPHKREDRMLQIYRRKKTPRSPLRSGMAMCGPDSGSRFLQKVSFWTPSSAKRGQNAADLPSEKNVTLATPQRNGHLRCGSGQKACVSR